MELIDTHCHLDRAYRKGDLDALLKRAAEVGVTRVIAVGTEPDDWSVNRRIAEEHPGQVYYSVGMHPCYVKEDWEAALEGLAPCFDARPAPCAIGEIGLDYFHLPKKEQEANDIISRQQQAFARQLAFARSNTLPIIIHSRNAFEDTCRMIDESGLDWSRFVYHCFAEGPEQIRHLIARGARASFTGIVTYKNAPATREALIAQGIDRLMVETDAPYLAPEPHRGKPNEPAWVRHVAERCASELGISIEALIQHTTQNAETFFGLPKT